jgi:hypothetical protein
MIHQRFLSEFADANLVARTLDPQPRLANLAFEFCNKFNTKLIENPVAHAGLGTPTKINVITNSGITIGALSVGEDSDGEYYVYHSNFINKERSSKRSDSRARDAKKINTLLRALDSHKDIPTDETVMTKLTGGLHYAYRATQLTTSTRIDLTNDLAIAMAEHILKINEYNLTNNMNDLKVRYDEYAKQKAKNEKNRALSDRFAEGATSICIFTGGRAPYYVVCDTAYDKEKDKAVFTGGVPKRVKSLSEVPELVSDVAIIKAYFDTHKNEYGADNNELGAPRRDKYYEDIDIATGYSESDLMWVIIPKKAP